MLQWNVIIYINVWVSSVPLVNCLCILVYVLGLWVPMLCMHVWCVCVCVCVRVQVAICQG